MSFPRVSNNGLFANNPIDPSWLVGAQPVAITAAPAYRMIARAAAAVLFTTGAAIVTDPVIAPGPAPAALLVYPMLWGPGQRGFLALQPFEQT
jgi:hypothetical protein